MPPVRHSEGATGLDAPVGVLRGVGGDRGAQLERLGIRTIGDLLLHRPRRYEDRRQFVALRDVVDGASVAVRARVVTLGVNRFRSGKSVFVMVVDDGTARLHCRWWNLPFLERVFAVGDDLLVFGRVQSLRPRTMDHPETEKVVSGDEETVHLNRWVPVYPLTEGLAQRPLRSLVWQALQQFGERVAEPRPELGLAGGGLPVPEAAGELSLQGTSEPCPARREALRAVHFPDSPAAAARARRRLALDEFVELQWRLLKRRRHLERHATALPCAGDNRWMRPFLAGVGFPLTGAQTRVLREIRAGLRGPVPMRRLLQGDVGSGKTLVAQCAALMTLEAGFSVAVMAPTEILAGQLADGFRTALAPFGIEVSLVTGSRKPAADAGAGRPMPDGTPSVVVGTQALIQPGFQMERLGLVIIDEQHKFGVAERNRLLRKGRYPHLLVMTATPIPRTLALTVYGDLDVSILDELPPGRRPVRTHVRSREALPKVWEFIRTGLARGRQAYVVYPRVEGGEAVPEEVKAVTRDWEQVRRELAPHAVGMLHGRMSAADKSAVMLEFREGRLGVLLATSVVEVGLDVPNATIMLVENAERFGLAQLHQLRGRIGRGAHESHCILVAGPGATPEGAERLEVVASCPDGFALAEADLRLRGPGELAGRDQSGAPPLRFGDLREDRTLVEFARQRVRAVLEA
ncbi:MAG: ATP-dependent DNA helicase RecG [Verrucomicrobiae bacterium]|nr:ATP-dependent DNA helicase RecG [Verrucomicrobiae bacterium]